MNIVPNENKVLAYNMLQLDLGKKLIIILKIDENKKKQSNEE